MAFGDDIWVEFNLGERITEILRNVRPYRPGHHLGLPGLTPYQIAIEFAQEYPDDFNEIRQRGFDIGGKGSVNRNSFAQLIGRQLSQRIGQLPDVEGFFVSYSRISEIFFNHESQDCRLASGNNPAVSVFRYVYSQTNS